MAQGIDRSDFADITGTYFSSYQPPSPVTDQAGFERYASFAQNELMPLIDKQVKYQESIKRQRNADLAYQQTQLSMQKSRDEAATQRKHFQEYSQIDNYVDSLIEGGGDASDMLNSFYDLRSKKPLLDVQSTKFLDLQEERIKAIVTQQKEAGATARAARNSYANKYIQEVSGTNFDEAIYKGIVDGDPKAFEAARQAFEVSKYTKELESGSKLSAKAESEELDKIMSFDAKYSPKKDITLDQGVDVGGGGASYVELTLLDPQDFNKAIYHNLRLMGKVGDPKARQQLLNKYSVNIGDVKAGLISPEEALARQISLISFNRIEANKQKQGVTTSEKTPFQESSERSKRKEMLDNLQGPPISPK